MASRLKTVAQMRLVQLLAGLPAGGDQCGAEGSAVRGSAEQSISRDRFLFLSLGSLGEWRSKADLK